MEDYSIHKSWLQHRVDINDSEWASAITELRPFMEVGDEIWFFDEPAPPDVNAGALGLAILRQGEVIRTLICGIH